MTVKGFTTKDSIHDTIPKAFVKKALENTESDKFFRSLVPDGIVACGCLGPINGQPLCPCQMRNVKVVDGRYVRVEDLGPVK